jgi:N-acetylglutamate synthase-like GNAT family acetyltransferase
MPAAELDSEIAAGVVFWGCELDGALAGVMGIQEVRDVDLIRHAYVAPGTQRSGVGSALLEHLAAGRTRRVLVGTWAAATWAIRFYERNGFELVPPERTAALMKEYWTISDRQIETSVVLERRQPQHRVRHTMAMAYDEALAERVRSIIGARDAVVERKMFGGVAWMLGGNMACGVLGDDLAVKMSPEDAERALAEPHTRPFEMTGRPARGFVVVSGAALAGDPELARWVDVGADHAASLPPK